MGAITGGYGPLRIMADGRKLALCMDEKNVMLANNALLRNCKMRMETYEICSNVIGGYVEHHPTGTMDIDLSFVASDIEFHKDVKIEDVFNQDTTIRDLFGKIADKICDRE